ncbi:MAG: Fmu (Sun) domain protein [Bacteroidetes bacterium]|nr:MAG: Fmu (Sun) domain protein [Bacteroidota bacterium]
MKLPDSLMNSLTSVVGFDREAFEKVHASDEQVTSIRINPSKLSEAPLPPEGGIWDFAVSWSQYGYYLNKRPSFTFDPLFHAGCYYVQEASSMFLEQALRQTMDISGSLKVLDLSAAPGGKSTHIQSLISKESLLVSNEVIRSRANTLKENIIKWGSDNVIVTNNDPKDFSKVEDYFDVIVADVPCSGSGLFRREPEAIEEWSENNVSLCSQRQQRILADALPALKKDGILIYSTCSYSKEEDEKIAEWLTGTLAVNDRGPTFESCRLSIDKFPGIIETISGNGTYGYRFWPDKIKGEGFFIACFRKRGGGETETRHKARMMNPGKKELATIGKWIRMGDHELIRRENTIYAWSSWLSDDMSYILSKLKVIYSGVRVGELMKDKLVPDHALAMSKLVNDSVERVELNYDQAIQYLQRKDLKLEGVVAGWKLACYQNHPLGWMNVLANRINNYYPKELRILKERQ